MRLPANDRHFTLSPNCGNQRKRCRPGRRCCGEKHAADGRRPQSCATRIDPVLFEPNRYGRWWSGGRKRQEAAGGFYGAAQQFLRRQDRSESADLRLVSSSLTSSMPCQRAPGCWLGTGARNQIPRFPRIGFQLCRANVLARIVENRRAVDRKKFTLTGFTVLARFGRTRRARCARASTLRRVANRARRPRHLRATRLFHGARTWGAPRIEFGCRFEHQSDGCRHPRTATRPHSLPSV